MRQLVRLFFLIALFVALLPAASQLYCGAAATGAGNGINWDNQCNFNSATLVRGNSYYIADGTYSRTTFATAASSTELIVIKKATIADHGIDQGWVNSMGDGQAVFGTITVTTPHWFISGTSGGGPGAWEIGLGIKVTGIDAAALVDENNDSVVLEHVEIAPGSVGPDSANAVVIDLQNKLTIRYAWIHDIGCDVFKIRYGADDFTLEYSKVARSYQDAGGCHGDLFEAQAATFNRWTIRYNFFEDVVGSYLFGAHDTATINGYWIYGNILHFRNKPSTTGNGTVGTLTAGGTINDLQFHNNTISGEFDSVLGIYQGASGVISGSAYNNIWHRAAGSSYSFTYSAITHGSNSHYNISPSVGGETNLSGDPFTASSTGDFTLTAATAVGVALADPYNFDMNGVQRGADGNWDRGAIEYQPEEALNFWVNKNTSDGNPILTSPGKRFRVNGTGSANVAISSTACPEITPYVGTITPVTTNLNVTAPIDITIRPKRGCSGSGGPAYGANNYTINITGSETRTLNVSVIVRRTFQWPTIVGPNKVANYGSSLCTDPWRNNWQTCGYTPTRPGTWTPPAVGSTYTDPIFGTVIKRVATGDIFRYANQHAINFDETKMTTLNCASLRLSDGVCEYAYSPLPYNPANPGAERDLDLRWMPKTMNPAEPEFFSNSNGDTGITTYKLISGVLTQQNRYECRIGPLNAWLNAPSTTGYVFRTNVANTHGCVINVLNGHTIVGEMKNPQTLTRDNGYISRGRDKKTGLHYVSICGDGGCSAYSFSESSTTFKQVLFTGQNKVFGDDGYFGAGSWELPCRLATSSWCIGPDHYDTAVIDGEQVMVTQNGWVLYFNRMGRSLEEMTEANAGTQILSQFFNHVGCADFSPYCAGYVRRTLAQHARAITNAVTNGSDIDLTLSGSAVTGLANGETAQINGVLGCTNANGNHVVGGISGLTVKLIGVTCNASYTSGGFITEASWQDSALSMQRVFLYRMSAVGATNLIVLGDHRSIWFWGAADDYFSGQPWPFLSPRGKWACWKSNLGTPNEWNIMCAEVNASEPGSDWITPTSRVTVTPTSSALTLSFPSGGLSTCSASASTTRDQNSPVTGTPTNSGGVMSVTLAGLSAGTQYWWRVDCDHWNVAANTKATLP